MGRESTNYMLPLAILQILHVKTDEESPITVSEIKTELKEKYSLSASDDTIRAILDKLAEFLEQQPEGFNSAFLVKEIIPGEKGRKRRAYVSRRLFDDTEVNYLMATTELSQSTANNQGESDVLISKLNSLKAPSGRKESPVLRFTPEGSPKPSSTEIAKTCEELQRAIDQKKSISFSYIKYSAKPIRTDPRELAINQSATTKKHVSPYQIKYMNEHFFLLARQGRSSDLTTYRVDLIKEVSIDTETNKYKGVDPERIENFFVGSINGYGGKNEEILLRCTKKSVHYVIELFSDFSNFTMRRSQTEDGRIDVSFLGYPKGIEHWCLKFVDSIELIRPVKTRESLITRLTNNIYRGQNGDRKE